MRIGDSMNSIIMWIFSKTAIGQLVDGKKTIIGACLILLAKVLEGLETVAPMFPQAPWLSATVAGIYHFFDAVAPILDHLGLAAISAGLLHKAAKAKA